MRNINLLNYKKFILKFSGCALSLPLFFVANSSISTYKAEVASFLPEKMIAEQGESRTNSLTTGTRATLTLGTSSSFGSSASVSSTDAYSMKANSAFVPVSGTYKSSFGAGFGASTYEVIQHPDIEDEAGNIIENGQKELVKTNENEGKIIANVSNLRSSGGGFHNTSTSSFSNSIDGTLATNDDEDESTDPDYLIAATDSEGATGNASIDGVTSSIELVLDPDKTFNTTEITYIEDNDDENPMATANGSSNLGLTNGLNVDLSNTAFNNAFSQAF